MVPMNFDVRIEVLAACQAELLAAKVSHPMMSLPHIPYILPVQIALAKHTQKNRLNQAPRP